MWWLGGLDAGRRALSRSYTSTAAAVRARLDRAGLPHVAQHVTEWFPCVLCKDQDDALGAAALGSTADTLRLGTAGRFRRC